MARDFCASHKATVTIAMVQLPAYGSSGVGAGAACQRSAGGAGSAEQAGRSVVRRRRRTSVELHCGLTVERLFRLICFADLAGTGQSPRVPQLVPTMRPPSVRRR